MEGEREERLRVWDGKVMLQYTNDPRGCHRLNDCSCSSGSGSDGVGSTVVDGWVVAARVILSIRIIL